MEEGHQHHEHSLVGKVVEYNRGDGKEYGLIVEQGPEGAKIAPVSRDATDWFKQTTESSVEGRGGEFRVLK